jgi:hypothetical protein
LGNGGHSQHKTVPKLNGSPVNLLLAPVVVPAGFVGVSANNVLAPSGVIYATTRNWDYAGGGGASAVCSGINTASGTFNWTNFDDLFSNSVGKDFIFTLGQPADWMISRAALGGSTYGVKGNMCPTAADTATGFANGLAAYVNFVTQAATRAKNTWSVTGIKWELWNEIDQPGFYSDAIASLGPYAKACYQAIKAVDSTAIVIAPSVGRVSLSVLGSFLSASDGAAGSAKLWIDGMAYHSYKSNGYSPTVLVDDVATCKMLQAVAGISVPLWMTEGGYNISDPTQAVDWQRQLVTLAALGVQCCLAYSYDNVTLAISGISAKWNTVANLLTGSPTISELYPGPYAVQARINGTLYTF